MNGSNLTAGVIALVLVAALAAAGWYFLLVRPPEICELSGRVIYANMRTVVRIDGRTYHTCCPRCPLTVARQTGGEVEFLRVTDNVSGEALEPAEAFYVDGSRVQFCHAPRIKLDEARVPYVQLFDRCGPSLIAFASPEDAREFIAENGGSPKRLDQLIRETREQPAGGQGDAGEPIP